MVRKRANIGGNSMHAPIPPEVRWILRGGWPGGDMILLIRSNIIVPTLETKRLLLIPFTLDLKKAAMNDRARLVEMLGVYVPENWPEPDLLVQLRGNSAGV